MNFLHKLSILAVGSVIVLSGSVLKLKNYIGRSSSSIVNDSINNNGSFLEEIPDELHTFESLNTIKDFVLNRHNAQYVLNDPKENTSENFSLKESTLDTNEKSSLQALNNLNENLLANLDINKTNEDFLTIDAKNNIWESEKKKNEDIVNEKVPAQDEAINDDTTKLIAKNMADFRFSSEIKYNNEHNIDNMVTSQSTKNNVPTIPTGHSAFDILNDLTEQTNSTNGKTLSANTYYEHKLIQDKKDENIPYIPDQNEQVNSKKAVEFSFDKLQENTEIQNIKVNESGSSSTLQKTNFFSNLTSLQDDTEILKQRLNELNVALIYKYIKKVEIIHKPENSLSVPLNILNSIFTINQIILQDKLLNLYTRYPRLIHFTSLRSFMQKLDPDFFNNSNKNMILYGLLGKYYFKNWFIRGNNSFYNAFCSDVNQNYKDITEFIHLNNIDFINMEDFRALYIELLFYKNTCQRFTTWNQNDPNYMINLGSVILESKSSLIKDILIINPYMNMQDFMSSLDIYYIRILKFLLDTKLLHKNIYENLMHLLTI